jgi:hypothetical protein
MIRNAILLIVALLLPRAMGYSQPSSKLLVGSASVNITPQAAVPLSGYANREQPSQGVHDDIYARAFVFENGNTKACLIQADLIGFSFDFVDALNREIEKEIKIPMENCFLVAVHNHGAPSTRVYGEASSTNLDEYLTQLKKKLVSAAVEAFSKREPARIGWGRGKCTMNINRRARHADGGIWLGRNPDGPCDHDVDVLRIDNLSGTTLGLLVNWPCHATTGGQENSLVTGDWPGSAARYVQKNFTQVPVAITAGASGDINPIYGPNNKFGDMDAIGLVLGEEIIATAKKISLELNSELSVRHRKIEVPGKERSASRMPGEEMIPGKPVKLRFSVVKVGTFVWAGISGEMMTEIGMKVKAQSPYRHTTIITHCNGSSGYLCTDEAYRSGGYEPMVSRTMPGVEKILVDNFLELINDL